MSDHPPSSAVDSRLEALTHYGRLADVGRERLDEIATLAAWVCETPIALVSFLDDSHLWLKGAHGWEPKSLLREITFCHHAISPPSVLSIPDALEDARFRDNPLVAGEPHIRAYAGAPLVTTSGHCLGTLCVIDRQPRHFNARQLQTLQLLARQVLVTLELLRQKSESLASEARLRSILDGFGPSIFAGLLSPDGIVLEANRTAYEATGMAPDQVIGRRFDELPQWTYSEIVLKQVRAALRDAALGKATRYDVRVKTSSGHFIDVDFSLAPVLDEHGKVSFLVPSGVLITERKKAERSVRRINRVYALLSGVRQSILRERTVEAILHSACRIAVERGGMAMAWIGMAEGPGDRIRIAAHAGASPDTLAVIERLLGDQPSLHCSVTASALRTAEIGVCNDIATDPIAASWSDEALARGYRSMAALPIRVADTVRGTLNLYNRETSFFTQMELGLLDELARDIGVSLDLLEHEKERALAEAALRRAEQRFREFADNVEQVFWIREADGQRVLYASPAYEKVWRAERSALYASPTGWRASILEQDLPHADAARRARESGAEATETYRITRPGGEVRWIREKAIGSRDESGAIIHIVGTAEDITESRNLEEHLRQAQKLEAIGQLAGGVAHDFNNILTIIEGFASLLAMETGLSTDGREAVHEITNAAARATKLTRQLLAFGRKQVMQTEAVDLNETLRALSSLLQRLVGEQIQLVLELHPSPCTARVDASMLDQIIMNLVINARDAMPRGGELRIATFVSTVDHNGGESGGLEPGTYAGFSVSDSGDGIAPEHLSRIFEPFFTTKGPGKGTGLGLSTVYGIVSQHRGAVFVRSVPNEGSRFDVWLPASTVPARKPAAAPRGATTTLKRPQDAAILLVEDDPHVRALTRTVLEREGYQVCEASHGPEALRVWSARGGQLDLLLTDMVMPAGMNGIELARELRKLRPDLPVLFMSGYSAEVAGHELADSERGHLIQKPSPPRAILEAVRRALVEHAERERDARLRGTT
jgi:PAS domain S-box-containing protein